MQLTGGWKQFNPVWIVQNIYLSRSTVHILFRPKFDGNIRRLLV